MRVAPTGSELLSTARTVFRERVMPYLAADAEALGREVEAGLALIARTLDGDRPAGSRDLEVFAQARTALRTKLLDALPAERRYDARLIAKVMAIATNELANAAVPEGELERLTALLRETLPADRTARGVRSRLAALYTRLCVDIRHGRTDPGGARYVSTYAHLCEVTRQAVSESNPAYLERRGRPAAPVNGRT